MANRNPSRTGKSEKEKQYLSRVIKGISSFDTAKAETPFDPSNVTAEDKTPKVSTRNRPQSLMRKVKNHLKRNLATYITCLIPIMLTFFVVPFNNLNREVGEVKTEVMNIKGSVVSELGATKQQITKLSDQLTDVLNRITSIKTYLLNKFGAKL